LHDGLFGARTFCRLRRIPLVFEMTLMGADDPATVLASRPFAARARHRAFRRADAYIAMSRAFLPAYESAGMPADRLHLIPQGVDTNRFRPLSIDARRAVRGELGVGADAPMVVFVGSLIERKGIDVLLDAWSRVHAARADASLVLVGRNAFGAGSAEAAFLGTHLAKLPAAARRAVIRTGLREDPERFLGAADAFVLPSRREGFGSVIIEAMAAGLPSIVTEMPGITDFVFTSPDTSHSETNSADGIVIPQEDAGALADALVSLLAERDRARAVGRRALETARHRFDFDAVVAPAYERLYTDLVTRNRRS
jgi:glycosyltransferase involved in cell wall biosynthesis